MFHDQNCTVKAFSLNSEVKTAIDVANTIATHGSNKCGVVGHLYPFEEPFGNVQCNNVGFEMSNYEDFQCKIRDNVISYEWGQCIEFNRTSQGKKFIKLYPYPSDNILVLNRDSKFLDAVYVLAAVAIFLALVIGVLSCCIYQTK